MHFRSQCVITLGYTKVAEKRILILRPPPPQKNQEKLHFNDIFGLFQLVTE